MPPLARARADRTALLCLKAAPGCAQVVACVGPLRRMQILSEKMGEIVSTLMTAGTQLLIGHCGRGVEAAAGTLAVAMRAACRPAASLNASAGLSMIEENDTSGVETTPKVR